MLMFSFILMLQIYFMKEGKGQPNVEYMKNDRITMLDKYL